MAGSPKEMAGTQEDEEGAAAKPANEAPKSEGTQGETEPKEKADADKPKEGKETAKAVDTKKLEGAWTGLLILCVFSSTIGGSFQFGYHIGCMNVPAEKMQAWFVVSHQHMHNQNVTVEDIKQVQWSIAVGVFAVGGMIGGLASGWCADKFGRKGAMMLNNVIVVTATALLTAAKYVNVYYLIMVGRVIIGINVGISSGLVPMYLTEISPINLRGILGSLNQLLVTFSIVFSQIIGLPQLLGTDSLWPMVFAFSLVPAGLQLGTMWMCPESPRYNLNLMHRVEQDESDLKKLRGKEDVEAEIQAMKEEAEAAAAVEKVHMLKLFSGDYVWPLFIAVMMMLGQQLSGINVAMYYSTEIFIKSGLAHVAVFATVGVGTVNFLMTLVSVYLVDHPKCGRRMLLLVGFSGMLVASVALVGTITGYDSTQMMAMAYLSMICVFLFVIGFATGPGSIPWFLVSELFESNARGSASSIAAMVNWTSNFIVGTAFLFLMGKLNQFAFLIFAGFQSFFIFFTFVYVPETKGRSVQEINEEFKKDKAKKADAEKGDAKQEAGAAAPNKEAAPADKEAKT